MVARNALSVAIRRPCLFLKAQFQTYPRFSCLLHNNAMLMISVAHRLAPPNDSNKILLLLSRFLVKN